VAGVVKIGEDGMLKKNNIFSWEEGKKGII